MFLGIVFIILLVICLNDFLFFRIEDSVNIALAAVFFIGWSFGYINNDLFSSLSIACLFFVLSAILNHFNMLGGGDVKLLFVIGLLVNDNIFTFLCALSVFSLSIALVYVAIGEIIETYRKVLSMKIYQLKKKKLFLYRIIFPSIYNISKSELIGIKQNGDVLKQEIPYGVILGISTIVTIFHGVLSGGYR